MSAGRRRWWHAATALSLTLATLLVAATSLGAPLVGSLDGGAAGTQPAQRVFAPSGDLVSITTRGDLGETTVRRAFDAASQAGTGGVVGTGFTANLSAVFRGGSPLINSSGDGWVFPISATSLDASVFAAVMGRQVSDVLNAGQVVISQTSAALQNGAQVGDVMRFRAGSGAAVDFVVGMVANDALVGGAELLLSTEQASLLGVTKPSRVLIYGVHDRARLDATLAQSGLTTDRIVRVSRSWDPPSPDGTLGLGTTKRLLGQFDFYVAGLTSSGWTSMNGGWIAANLPADKETFALGIRARCHNVVRGDLRAALDEVAGAGLGWAIDVANTNTYGGCFVGAARFTRNANGLGSVSRHSWGQPIDMNTRTNCQGCVPQMDCRVVQIFRKHNFAWGGNFLTPDGMHFEWVGSRPQNLATDFPLQYCPNPGGRTQAIGPPGDIRDQFFAQDAWLGVDDHE